MLCGYADTAMHRLRNPVRPYAWGSSTHIPLLCGQPVSPDPVAEMWFGAHPADPSKGDDGRGLDLVIEQDPVAALGAGVVQTFGPRLPFLMKLLAAAEPLSLQVHPDTDQAAQGFANQSAAGVPLGDPARSYQDRFHKPELIYALTRFEGMAGFRDTSRTVAILRMFELDFLDRIADELDRADVPATALREIVTRLLDRPGPETARDLRRLGEAAVEAEKRSHHPRSRRRPPEVDASSVERESLRVFSQTVKLIDRYPEDPGVLVTLLLNHVVLAAGDAMFLDAGIIHAYTSGFGVEIMASSDNVLRAGLTPKHVDIPELLRITDFAPIPPPRWPRQLGPRADCITLAPPVGEFELVIHERHGDESELVVDGPAIVLCLAGAVTAEAGTGQLHLDQGQACFVAATDSPVTLTGRGRAAIARTPAQQPAMPARTA